MKDGQRPLEISYDAAVEASLAGDHDKAVWIMRWLLEVYGAPSRALARHPSVDVRLDYYAAGADSPRRLAIFARSTLLGRAGVRLEPAQRTLIETLLDTRWREWESGARRPPGMDVYDPGEALPAARLSAITVAIVFSQHIHANPDYVESDFYHHLGASAANAGLVVHRFAADRISSDSAHNALTPRPTRPIEEELAELAAFLDRTRPDIVVFDGNFEPTPNTVGPDHWAAWKRRLGFKLVAVIPDSYDLLTVEGKIANKVAAWRDCTDLILAAHPRSVQIADEAKVTLTLSFPFDEPSFRPGEVRDIGLCSIGRDHRDRSVWINPVAASGVHVFALHHDHRRGFAPDRDKYLEMLGRSRMLFNNGYVSPSANIVTGRFFEGILSRTLVLQEDGSPIDRYFAPFIHYVPVGNVDELITFARFFEAAPDWRLRVTEAALSFWRAHYDSARMWRFLCARVMLDAPAEVAPARDHFTLPRSEIDDAFVAARNGGMPARAATATAERFVAAGEAGLAADFYSTWLGHTESAAAPAIWFNLGVILIKLADPLGGNDAFRQALALDPDFEPARRGLELAAGG